MKTEKNILVAFILNISFSLFELFGGIFTRSVAIISDSIHDIGDALSIGISYFLEKKSKRKPDNNYTYGYIRYSVLGAAITNVVLFAGSVLVIYNSIIRIFNPVEINYDGMILFAVVGVVVNFLAAYFTRKGKSLNQKAVNLHMFEDVLGWIIILLGAIVMKFTNISIIDPIMSIIVALYIVLHASKNFESILNLFLEKIPDNISVDEIKNSLLEIKGIKDIHHIHVWSIDGYNNCATMHVVIEKSNKKIKHLIKEELLNYGITHTTVELEYEDEICEEIMCHNDIKIKHKH